MPTSTTEAGGSNERAVIDAGKGTSSPHEEPGRARALELGIHRLLSRALALEDGELNDIVTRMFVRRRRDAVVYWLQLLLSMGIATLGLALGSTAVVIGAMLVSPLMAPLVELGMALVVGSAALTVRSLGRTVGSVVAVVAGAALLTMALPFHELNPEITSRTIPTALDLLIATFVALAAVLTTVRPTSDTTSAAAGAAIGIALVPPLCVIGLGLGMQDLHVAGGATLLFVTNLTAILFISVMAFWALGFETVSASHWEETILADARPGGLMSRAMHLLQALFGSRYSKIVRVAVPALLLAAVSFPLREALDRVAWEVSARNTVSRIVGRALAGLNAVRTTVTVNSGSVALQVYVVGSADTAAALQRRLEVEIASATEVTPSVRVIAVPDQSILRQVTGSGGEPDPGASVRLSEVRGEIGGGIAAIWPGQQLGPIVGWSVEFPDSAEPEVTIRHAGGPAGLAVDAMLLRALGERIGTSIGVRTIAYAPEGASEPPGRGTEWLPAFIRVADVVRGNPGSYLCVVVPVSESLDGVGQRVAGLVRTELQRIPAPRASLRSTGDRWSVRLSAGPCEPTTRPGTNAEADSIP